MRSLLLIAAVLVAGALALKDGQVCDPGSNFKMDCNTCRCSADGKLVSCTRKFCVPEEQGDDPKVQTVPDDESDASSNGSEKEEEHVHTNGQVCTPNEVKMEDCNRCKCAANGIGWFCTRKACPPREKRDALRSTLECTPGTNFKSSDGCNDCFCTETGVAACTQKACFHSKTKRNAQADQDCVPGTTFKSADGCNDCFCTETGHAACTEKACLNHLVPVPYRKRRASPVKQECVPGTSFKSADGCNDCTCTENGVAACTLRFCFSEVDAVPYRKKRDSPAKCVPGTSFKSGCNDCVCSANGVPSCKLGYCSSGPALQYRKKRDAPAKQECVPGTSFKSADGCNDCFCSDNGMAACTLRFCFPDAEAVQQRSKRDATADKKCVAGTSYTHADGCNTCVCGPDGVPTVCTTMFCFNDPRIRRSANDEPLPRSEIAPGAPGFACEPAKSFKYQCNTCRCDTSGQSAACTYKFCLPGEY